MKLFLLIASVLVVFITSEYVKEVSKIDKLVYDLYVEDFKDYIVFDENFEVRYDKDKLRSYFENKGYKLKFEEGILCFKVSLKRVFKYEKRYAFYLENNNEIK